MVDYLVAPFRRPLTEVMTFPAGGPALCARCGNDDPSEFWTVTSLAGDTLRGFVCAICETKKEKQS